MAGDRPIDLNASGERLIDKASGQSSASSADSTVVITSASTFDTVITSPHFSAVPMNSVAWLCRNPTTQISLCLISRLQSRSSLGPRLVYRFETKPISRLLLLLVERIEYAILPVRREAMIRQVVPVLLIAIAVTATATHGRPEIGLLEEWSRRRSKRLKLPMLRFR